MARWFDGEKARTRRLILGLRQTELARAAQVSQSHLSEIERGLGQPSPPAGRRIAIALGMEPDDLLCQEPVS